MFAELIKRIKKPLKSSPYKVLQAQLNTSFVYEETPNVITVSFITLQAIKLVGHCH